MKTTATTEAVSSSPEKMGIGTTMASNHLHAPVKNRWRTEKMSCKTMKQNEMSKITKKQSTPSWRETNGKSQIKTAT